MTCIVAMADGQYVIMGGDSAGTDGRDLYLRADAKVFQKGQYLIGFTTSFRMGQILRYETELPEVPQDPTPENLERFFVTEFIPAVRRSFEQHGFAKTARISSPDKPGVSEDGQVVGGTFLVGVAGQIFEIRGDYQLGRPVTPYSAVGAGAMVALGALRALEVVEGLSLRDRVTRALETAEAYSAGVRGPFQLVELSLSEVHTAPLPTP